VQLVVEVLFTC